MTLISYSFLYFTAWLVNINNSGTAVCNMLATSKSCGNICFFQSTLPTMKDNFTSFSLMIKYLVAWSFKLWLV